MPWKGDWLYLPGDEALNSTDPLKTVRVLYEDQEIDKQKDFQSNQEVFSLQLIDFFEHFDSGCPYHLSAISELQSHMPKSLLRSDADWFATWSVSGRR